MKTFNRVDLVPISCSASVVEDLKVRANKCSLTVADVQNVVLGGKFYTELFLQGTRWGYFKYWGIALLKGEAEKGAIPGVIKLMFM